MKPLVPAALFLALAACAAPRLQNQLLVPLDKPAFVETRITIGLVDDAQANEFVEAMEKAAKEHTPVVFVTIDSPGGSVNAGLEMYDAMRSARDAGVMTVCTAEDMAASMAFVLFQACDVRIAHKYTQLMSHEISIFPVGGKPGDLRRWADLIDEYGRRLLIIETAKLKITPREFEKRIKGHDYWITWDEALEIGAVDQVLGVGPDVVPL